MRLQNIVVGVDFTPATTPALEQALAMALHHDAELTLVHGSGVTESGMAVYAEGMRSGDAWTDYVTQRLLDAEQSLKRAAERCRGAGAKVKTRLVSGPPDSAVVATAGDVLADLVVVGTHGRSGPERWLQGSVAERVVRTCGRNVLVAMGDAPPRAAWQRVLVGTDFSLTADLALRTAVALSAPHAKVEVVHAFRPSLHFGLTIPPDLKSMARARAFEHGNQLLAQHSGTGRALCFDVIDGDPVNVLVGRMADFEVVVLGSHGRRGVSRLILGSVAENVLREASRTTLVVHGDS